MYSIKERDRVSIEVYTGEPRHQLHPASRWFEPSRAYWEAASGGSSSIPVRVRSRKLVPIPLPKDQQNTPVGHGIIPMRDGRVGRYKQDGVDVLLAVDLVLKAERDEADAMILISSDTDFGHAVEVAAGVLRVRHDDNRTRVATMGFVPVSQRVAHLQCSKEEFALPSNYVDLTYPPRSPRRTHRG
jgi:uncharacterized LabA/DUF88 family protein